MARKMKGEHEELEDPCWILSEVEVDSQTQTPFKDFSSSLISNESVTIEDKLKANGLKTLKMFG